MTNQALLSPQDNRDYEYSALTGIELPSAFEVWQPPVANQKATGNCTAQAVANIKECWLYRREEVHKDFSVGFIYGYEQRETRGLACRKALSQMVKVGDCLKNDFESNFEVPYVCKQVEWKRELLEQKAAGYKSQRYVRLYTKEQLKSFIYEYQVPVLIVIETKHIKEKSTGYHAMAAYGWRDSGDTVFFTNSWGEAWDDDGKGEIGFDKLVEIWGLIELTNTGRYQYPFKKAFVFGTPYGTKGGIWKAGWHSGLDLKSANYGGDGRIYPIAEGVVDAVARSDAYGNYVMIRHDDGYISLYAHLHSIVVGKGQRVALNTVIGIEGTTGNSTGVHLHLEIHKGEYSYPASIDPQAFIEERLYKESEEEHMLTKTKLLLNGVEKEVQTIQHEGHNYIKLRDLVDDRIAVDYDAERKLPILEVRDK